MTQIIYFREKITFFIYSFHMPYKGMDILKPWIKFSMITQGEKYFVKRKVGNFPLLRNISSHHQCLSVMTFKIVLANNYYTSEFHDST